MDKFDESDSISPLTFLRRIDSLMWIGVGALMLFAGSTLWRLSVEVALLNQRFDSVEKQLLTQNEVARQLAELSAQQVIHQTNWQNHWGWKRAVTTDISNMWRQSTLTGNPKSSEIGN